MKTPNQYLNQYLQAGSLRVVWNEFFNASKSKTLEKVLGENLAFTNVKVDSQNDRKAVLSGLDVTKQIAKADLNVQVTLKTKDDELAIEVIWSAFPANWTLSQLFSEYSDTLVDDFFCTGVQLTFSTLRQPDPIDVETYTGEPSPATPKQRIRGFSFQAEFKVLDRLSAQGNNLFAGLDLNLAGPIEF
ncbi:MAG: hypothetical protein AAFQ98_17360 [Bacteroidota bacterium]